MLLVCKSFQMKDFSKLVCLCPLLLSFHVQLQEANLSTLAGRNGCMSCHNCAAEILQGFLKVSLRPIV
jgi:hypothetical protein